MDVLIVLGDQDTYHENDAEIDASPIWLSDILSAEGIVAQFVIHARRAEILAEFGRADTIRAMRRHEIGLHGRDVHPILPGCEPWSSGRARYPRQATSPTV